jgi:hypothetical protein
MNIDHLTTANDIIRNGVSIVGDGEPREISLAYSIGRYEKGWPEVAVLINTEEDRRAADALLLGTANRPLDPGDRIQLKGHGPTWIAVTQRAGQSAEERLHLEAAEEYYGREVPILILIQETEFLRLAPCRS